MFDEQEKEKDSTWAVRRYRKDVEHYLKNLDEYGFGVIKRAWGYAQCTARDGAFVISTYVSCQKSGSLIPLKGS